MSPSTAAPIEAYALNGRVVTMDATAQVIEDGTVYIRDGTIVEVATADAPPPLDFVDVPVVATGGTIYPGLIELHNHLSYDALPLWAVPQQYTDRDQWGSGGSNAKVYRQLVSGPMTILGKSPELSAAVARYVECKALAGGVTTSQGIALFSNSGIPRYYKGALRNVEQTLDPNLPGAHDRIGDVAAADAELFLASLERYHRVLLHLSEGTDQAAEEHFLSLHLDDGRWAITPSLVGIHSVALGEADFRVMADHGASVVWSPLSNLLLYGDTMDIASAKKANVPIGLGSDWSPSGSKNLFGELKVARLVSEAKGGVFSDLELMRMATSVAASILGWDQFLGSIEKGKYADLVVLFGRQGDPYLKFLSSRETSIELVIVQGVPRLGRPGLMASLGADEVESFTIARNPRALYLKDPAADPLVGSLTFTQAKAQLSDALNRLPELASALEHPTSVPKLADANLGETRWFLQLDHDESPGFALRPHLPDPSGFPTAMPAPDLAAAEPLSTVLTPLTLDPLTVADDRSFLTAIGNEPNVWADVKAGLPDLYG
jgi:cytosine/adenosine deaminase-related metal-dependent hydrolase